MKTKAPHKAKIGFCHILTVASILILSSAPWAGAQSLPDAAKVAKMLGYNQEDMQQLMSGEIVAVALEDLTKKELALTVAMLLKVPVPAIYQRIQQQEVYKIARIVLSHDDIPAGPVTAATLAALRLDPSEVKNLSKVKPGSTFNLSKAEIASVRAAAPGGSGAVMQAYRKALAARVNAYRSGGLNAIAPYDRGKNKTSAPAKELRIATGALTPLKKQMPQLYNAFLNYPKDQIPSVASKFSWSVQTIQDRPTVILTQRMMGKVGGAAVMLERQFYVGQSYNSLQLAVGVLPVKQGSMVFYINRTSTDQVAGFASGTAHKIGKSMMEKQVKERFAQARAAFEK